MTSTAAATEIIPRMWLGNIRAAKDTEFHRAENIAVVFNCTKTIPFLSIPHQKHQRIPVDDNLKPVEIQAMTQVACPAILDLDRHYSSGKTILVHCHAGAQRSAAIVAMQLIYKFNMTRQQAIDKIRGMRAVAFRPGVNFQESISRFEHGLRSRSRTMM